MRFDTWRSDEFLKHYRREALRRELVPLKYADLPNLRSACDMIACAEKTVPQMPSQNPRSGMAQICSQVPCRTHHSL